MEKSMPGIIFHHRNLSKSINDESGCTKKYKMVQQKTTCKCKPHMLNYQSVIKPAGMAEWQTHQTQNLTGVTSCEFESRCRHETL